MYYSSTVFLKLLSFNKKVSLVVNVASAWGKTARNYEQLKILDEKYRSEGLEILAFPCNQFLNQEPGSNKEIENFVRNNKKCNFLLFDKIHVNGPNTHPVYQYLKSATDMKPIGWNFDKYLCDKKGNCEHYPSSVDPLELEDKIKQFLATPSTSAL